MTLKPRERFELITQIRGALQRGNDWSTIELDTLLQQFGMQESRAEAWGDKLADFLRILGEASDATLLAMYATVRCTGG